MQTIAAVAACLLLFVTGGLTLYFTLRDGSPAYRYEEADISISESNEEYLLSVNNLYLPDLFMLSEKSYWVGKHNESNEDVYFAINGIFDDGVSFRHLELTIILKNEYKNPKEDLYLNLANSFITKGKTVYYDSAESEFPFYSYYVAFKTNNVRYYFDYTTIEEGDVEMFFAEFLK